MIAAGCEYRCPAGASDVVRVDVLSAGGDDGLPDLAAGLGVSQCVGVTERVLTGTAPRTGRFALRFDHFADESERIGVESRNGLTVEWVAAEQNRLAEPKVVDPPEGGRVGEPAEVGGVPTRHGGDREAERCFDVVDEGGEFGHVVVGRFDAVAACKVRADPAEAEGGVAKDVADDRVEFVRHDAIAEVAEFDHDHDVVDSSADACGGRERGEDIGVGVDAHRVRPDDSIGLAEHRRSDEQHWCVHVRVAHSFDVLDARVAECDDARGDECVRELYVAEQCFRDAGDRDPASGSAVDETSSVLADLVEVDLESESAHRAETAVGRRSGNAAKTMSTRRSTGRVRASVAGIASSAS